MNKITLLLILLINFPSFTMEHEQANLNKSLIKAITSDCLFKRKKISELIAQGANPNIEYHNELLLSYCFRKDLSLFHFLLDEEININATDSNGNNILHSIARFKLNRERFPKEEKAFKFAINKVLKAGVNIMHKNKFGQTPISIAHKTICQFLIDCIIDFDIQEEEKKKQHEERKEVMIEVAQHPYERRSILHCCD